MERIELSPLSSQDSALPLYYTGIVLNKYFKGSIHMNEFLKNGLLALLPILSSGVLYVVTVISEMQDEIQDLKAKVSLVVTDDNKQAVNTGSELAREKLRQDLISLIEENKEDIAVNRQSIAVLEERVGK
jgi:RNase P/RNase MRP subunit p30